MWPRKGWGQSTDVRADFLGNQVNGSRFAAPTSFIINLVAVAGHFKVL
jgi:hypothetical protein